MKEVSVGDVLRLNRASILGSRDYTLKAGLSGLPPNAKPALEGTGSAENPYLDERLFVCRARVIGVDTGPMMIKEKTKRRQRRVKTVKSKHKYTVLKIMEVKVKSLEEIAAEGGNEQLMVLE
ncbi:putative aconitate hydratase [Phaeomoniella chlamydospora]|uniref:Putative aconitate hydratase n=1 Tax=Phaeomoniella chlamydospora TaxID=158046 RepID=A0A0G2E688_PHACM|nr:putative aconitate hydratase [Phaeomoniella chlamydospora]